MLREYFGGKKVYFPVHPDEAVAFGAAVEATVLSLDGKDSAIQNVRLMDVTPLSLEINIRGGLMSMVIHRNTRIPCEQLKMNVTSADYQE